MSWEIGVLGPLTLGVDGYNYLPSAPKPRQLLALLALNANRVISAASCIDELWGSAPPASAMSTLQTYVLHVRKALGRVPAIGSLGAARAVLTTHTYGYALQACPDDVDAFRFGMLVREGQRAQEAAQHARATELLGQALDVWRGDVLVDVQLGPMLQIHARALEEARLGAWECRVESDLRLGRHHLLLGELVGRAAQHPANENIHAQLMVALYRSGRPADALAVYLRLRSALRRELGLDPSARLQELYQAVLRADPVLDSRATRGHGLSLDLAVQRTGS